MRRLTLLLVAVLSLSPSALAAVEPLTLERIMSHPDWIGNPPEDAYWADDGTAVYYERKRDGEERRDLWRLDLSTGKAETVADADRGTVDARGGELSRDGRLKVYVRRGDVYLKDLTTGALRQITRTAEEERFPRFLASGARLAWRRGNAFYVHDWISGLTSQAVDLQLAKDPAEEKDKALLAEQETRLFDILRERQAKEKARREAERAEQAADPTRPPLPFYLGDEVTIEQLSLSPAADRLLLSTSKKKDRKTTKLARHVTESGNVEIEEVRAKVGTDPQGPEALVLLDLANQKRTDLDLGVLPGIREDPLKELKAAAKAARKEKKDKDKDTEDGKDGKDEKKTDGGKPEMRPVEVARIAWSDDGAHAAVQLRAHDNKDRWIATVDFAQGVLVPRHRLTDPSWVSWDLNDFGFVPKSHGVWFLSEETGFSQLFLLDAASGTIRPLTQGRHVVADPQPDPSGRFLYYRANPEHPGIWEVFRVEVASGKSEQLTRLGGMAEAVLSPDEKRLLVTHSSLTRPDELFVQDSQPEAPARQVTDTRSQEFLAVEWTVPEVVAIPSTHGAPAPIYSRVYTPPGAASGEKRPAVVFVHGAGYLQNAHYGWSGYFREFMFHTLLTRRGYVVLDMDYRASAGYGRDWRTAIYRQMGHPELEDLKDGVAWLAANKNVDPRRVGVYGGSYGGFLTFMALFREPDLFAAGAALRPVADWAHYNHGYTSAILNTPEVDPEAFRKSSPIEYAAGLTKPLLICAPMLDDNVFFQDSVRLVQRLIELKKEGFETAVYPVERHGFVEPTSWLDEYRRIWKLMETHVGGAGRRADPGV